MAAIRINLFGRLAVFVDDRPLVVGIPNTKPLELLAYLLVYRRHSHPRETVAALLWPELPPSHVKKNLRKVLCMLQQRLSSAAVPDVPSLLLIEHNWIGLNPGLELQIDVASFEQAHALAQRHAGAALDTHTAQLVMEAVALYEGELLVGLYSDWCLLERERLENMYLELCHLLLIHAESQQAYAQAITYGLEILRLDRANERAHCDLMRLYYLSGNRSAALHQYEHCVVTLANELGVKPRTSTEEIYRQICQDSLITPSTALIAEPADPRRGLGANGESRSHLQQVRAELQRILEQVQDEIRHVESLMKT